MAKNNNRLVIVALLPKEASEQIVYIQREHQNTEWKIIMPPHITMLRPGTARLPLEQVIEQFGSIELSTTSFPVVANYIDIFANGDNANVVYLKVEENPQIVSLHKELLHDANVFMEANEDFGSFSPHVTLANDIANEQEVDEVATDMKAKELSLDFICDRVHLFKKTDEDHNWVWLAENKLKN